MKQKKIHTSLETSPETWWQKKSCAIVSTPTSSETYLDKKMCCRSKTDFTVHHATNFVYYCSKNTKWL
jgi:hypothetical protein